MERWLKIAGILCLALAPSAYGQALNQPHNSDKIYRSAYYLGRGNTGVAHADDEEAIFYNPAGLAAGKGIYKKTILASPHVELSQATRDLARQLSAEDSDAVDTVRDHVGKPNHVGFSNFTGLILRRAALGVVATGNVDVLAFKSPEFGGLEVVEAAADQTVGATFSLAEGFFDNGMLLGVTAKYLARGRGYASASAAEANDLKDKLSNRNDFLAAGEGGGADFGVQFRGGGKASPSFGVTVNDIGDTKVTPTDPTTLDLDIKQTINAGVSIEPGTKFSKLKLLADYRDIASRTITNPRKKLHLGGELSVLDMVGMTGGLNQGDPTAGHYFDIYLVRVDLGMYTEEVGDRVGTRPDTRYFLKAKVGF
jgi:hypothetical protein